MDNDSALERVAWLAEHSGDASARAANLGMIENTDLARGFADDGVSQRPHRSSFINRLHQAVKHAQ
ncbi:MAG TPA: hypothetical protein VFS42_07225, partial [Burkholderiaceae bacterium]|nr:hypothetical protein [Burkholderiaceae bacterium]